MGLNWATVGPWLQSFLTVKGTVGCNWRDRKPENERNGDFPHAHFFSLGLLTSCKNFVGCTCSAEHPNPGRQILWEGGWKFHSFCPSFKSTALWHWLINIWLTLGHCSVSKTCILPHASRKPSNSTVREISTSLWIICCFLIKFLVRASGSIKKTYWAELKRVSQSTIKIAEIYFYSF